MISNRRIVLQLIGLSTKNNIFGHTPKENFGSVYWVVNTNSTVCQMAHYHSESLNILQEFQTWQSR